MKDEIIVPSAREKRAAEKYFVSTTFPDVEHTCCNEAALLQNGEEEPLAEFKSAEVAERICKLLNKVDPKV